MAYFYRFPDWVNIDFVIYFPITVTSRGQYSKQFPGASQGTLVVKICQPIQHSQERQILRVAPRVQEIPWRGSSVAHSCPTLCDPMNHSTPGLPVHHHLPEFTQTHVHESVMPSSHLILGRPLLLLPPIPPSIRVFSNESTLCIRWPKY